jgi:hypothetical protein
MNRFTATDGDAIKSMHRNPSRNVSIIADVKAIILKLAMAVQCSISLSQTLVRRDVSTCI